MRRSHAEPCGKKFPAILTPPMKAMMIGLGKNEPSPIIAEIIGRSMMVTGVPARNADKREEMPNVIRTAKNMLFPIASTKLFEINSEKPKWDKEFARMNKIANMMMILHEISFFKSENLVSFE